MCGHTHVTKFETIYMNTFQKSIDRKKEREREFYIERRREKARVNQITHKYYKLNIRFCRPVVSLTYCFQKLLTSSFVTVKLPMISPDLTPLDSGMEGGGGEETVL